MAFSPKEGTWHFHQRRDVALTPKEGRGIFTKGEGVGVAFSPKEGVAYYHLRRGVAFSPKEGRGIFT